MRCDEFWKKELPEFLIDREPVGQGMDHLEQCDSCRGEMEEMQHALAALKEDIRQEEPAAFWHGMRSEINARVRTPGGAMQFFRKWILSGRRWSAALAMAGVVLLALWFKPGAEFQVLSEEEIPLLVGNPQLGMVYDSGTWEAEISVTAKDETSLRLELDDWGGLMADVIEQTI